MAFSPITVRDGNNTAQSMGAMQDASSVNYSCVSMDSNRAFYRASASRVATITTATKTLISIQGSATKTVRIYKIGIWITAATAAEFVLVLQRTSALGAGGTTVSPTIGKLDTNSAAATAVVSHYTTGAQAQGTGVGGPLSAASISQSVTTSAPTFLGSPPYVMLFPEFAVGAQALVLRGTGDYIEVQNVGATGTTPATSYFVEWCEDAS